MLNYHWLAVRSDHIRDPVCGFPNKVMYEHLQHTSLPYMVLAGDTDSKQTSFRPPSLQDIYMLEILPLSSQFEYNMSGTRKDNKRKSTPSPKFGDNSKLSVLIGIDPPLPSSHRTWIKPKVLQREGSFSSFEVPCNFKNIKTQVFFFLFWGILFQFFSAND